MATRKTIEKIMRNWTAYYLAYDSKIEIQKNGVKVDDFTLNQDSDKVINILVPTNADYVDLTSAQSIWWVKTFTSAPVVPSKTTDATNSWTAIATESQVYKKQDALTLPSTPTSWHLVVWWANNKTFADWWVVPTSFEPWTWTTGQILRKTASWYQWSDEVGQVYTAWNWLDLTSNEFSIDTTVVATKTDLSAKQDTLIAGSNIQIANDWKTISATDTTYPTATKSDLDTWTSTTASVYTPKAIAEYVSWRIGSAVNYQWQVNTYADLPASPSKWDMYNVVQAHTTTPKFDAWTNVVWNGTAWDPMAEMVDLSNLVDKTSAQTISWVKTFTAEPVLPSKTSSATNDGTKPATEKQVYDVAQSIPTVNNSTVSFTQAWVSAGSMTTNQASASTIALTGNLLKTATEYGNLPSSKSTDWNRYFIYTEVETA